MSRAQEAVRELDVTCPACRVASEASAWSVLVFDPARTIVACPHCERHVRPRVGTPNER
jgi:ribosomal protein S27E